ncbi:MAG: outer membrane beta-barrel protein [Bacteriovorax sp.]|nr:outer membrane beta-barrel protein [Bacteriovorax sp.]
MKKLILLSSIFMAFAGVVRADETAGLFVEPMLTWERGRGDVNFPAPISSANTELDGFGVGARVGGHIYESIFLGADARYSIPNFKTKAAGLNQDIKSKAWNVGPVAGVQMPTLFGLRVWASWVVAGEVDPDMANNVNEKFTSGQGYRVGAGVKLSIVSLNIEYQKIKYSTTVLEDVGVFTPNISRNDVQLDNDSMILSVSFPLAI